MLIVYRKIDKKILFNSGTSFVNPEGMSDINGKIAVIERIGGEFDDYGTYRLHDLDDAEKVESLLNAHEYELTFDEEDIPNGFNVIKTKSEYLSELPPMPPSEIELLQQENANLLIQNASQDMAIQDLQTENAELMIKIAMLEVGASV